MAPLGTLWSPDKARAIFGPVPGTREIRLACWAALLVTILLVALSMVYSAAGRPFLGHPPCGDYVQFYAAGKILNEYPPARLYDQALQYRLQHTLLPEMRADLSLVYVNSPIVSALFRPLARVPLLWSYGLWVAISALLYVAGLRLLWPPGQEFGAVSRTAFLACLAFSPFAIECCAGGQLSAVGFFALALCTRWRVRYPIAAGAALALCLYKPTLLVLLAPMLIAGRRFRMLLGFAPAAAALAALSLAAVGYDGCLAYVRTLRLFAEFTARDPSPLPLFKFVDIRTFFRLLFGGHPASSAGAALILTGAAFVYLAVRWARSRPGTRTDALLWAATIAWTLVFNLYVPIYDTVLIVISALAMAGAVYAPRREGTESERGAFLGWMLVLYVAAWVTQPLASFARFQVLTLVLAAIGALALRLSRQAKSAAA